MQFRDPSTVQFAIAGLGEIMLRFAPVDGRIQTANEFRLWHGGGEYNVARAFSYVFGEKATHVTALVENPLGERVRNFMREGGVDTSHITWQPFDGLGREARIGLNFTEAGYGVMAPLGISDRGHSAASKLRADQVDSERLFVQEGVQILHSGGIFAALSRETSDTVIALMQKAKAAGTVTSFDLNFRASLYKSRGGSSEAISVNTAIVQNVDVLVGNEEDFEVGLGLKIPGLDKNRSKLDPQNFQRMIEVAVKTFPNLKVIATSLRTVVNASSHNWAGVMWNEGEFFVSKTHEQMPVLDRVGGGDSFASGLLWALLHGYPSQEVINIAVAHGALAVTTPGDTSMARKSEVLALAGGGSARIQR